MNRVIRLVFALRRQPHLTLAEFQDYWLNQHAPLVASFATDLNILRYVQTHTIESRLNEAAQSTWENGTITTVLPSFGGPRLI